MGESEFRLAVAIQIRHPAALGFDRMGNKVLLPKHTVLFRVLIPPEPVRLPSNCDNVGNSVVIYVNGPFAAVGDKLTDDIDTAVLMHLPLAALRTRVFIPICSTEDVRTAISIHIDHGDAFRVVCTKLMRKERHLGYSIGTISSLTIEV